MSNQPSLTGMSHLNTSFDPDIDAFLNLDNDFNTPVSASPNTSAAPSLARHPSSASTATTFASSSTPQTFSGPSFQYDAHRQQTGLPAGGLANTFAVNQASGMQYYDHHAGFVMPIETLNIPLSKLEDFDFARHTSQDMSDMDFDADSPSDLPTMFYPPSSSSQGQFISPTTLVAQSNSSTTSTPVQRIYPGMHSQQAAQAKAQQAQKQQEMMRQQQQRQLAGQKPLPTQTKSQLAKDPLVEESISRLLSQMRQNSVATTADDEGSPMDGMSNAARLKKDEDEMDEDERLLASEEGKKLSSKERRQLRNKVSARAFRSRRKEYIGQLEGEVATKAQEANDLRAENRQLREENTRLTDLTRMLLSSQAFSGFLQELSQSGMSMPSTQPAPQQQGQTRPRPQPTQKDVNPHEAARKMQSQQPQIGMALVPEPTMDMSLYDIPAWNTTMPPNDFHVFSVTEVPEGPVLDLSIVSGKDSHTPVGIACKDLPSLPAIPILGEMVEHCDPNNCDNSISSNQDDFALYLETSKSSPSQLSLRPAILVVDMKQSDLELKCCESEPAAGGLVDGMMPELEQTCRRLSALMPNTDG